METKMKNKLETLKIVAQRETEEGKRTLSWALTNSFTVHLYDLFDILKLIHFYWKREVWGRFLSEWAKRS